MNDVIIPDDFTVELWEILKETGSAVDTGLNKALEQAAKDTAKELKQISPSRSGLPKRYASGWTWAKRSHGQFIVYNRTHYRLTHLLEKGHRTRLKTGRYGSKPMTRAIPHISVAENTMKETIGKLIEDEVGLRLKKI